MKTIFTVFLAMIAFNGCASSEVFSMNKNCYIPAEYVTIADQITIEVGNTLIKRHNLILSGVSGGMAGCVNTIGLSFHIRGVQSKERLRYILVDSVEEFLRAINSNERLRPHLKRYPFTSEEITIEIFVRDEEGREQFDPAISVAAAGRGRIDYKTVARENVYAFKSRVQETYEEAKKIVEANIQ